MGWYSNWKEKQKEKKEKQAEKYKKPSLEERLEELKKKHGELEATKMENGKLHYYFIDGAIVFFESTLSGMKAVYKNKGFVYN